MDDVRAALRAARLFGASLGQELWSVSIIFVGLSSILGSLNYITTIINNRAPGMTWFRMPLSIWSLFITAILGLLALPVLSGAAIMLLFDQIIGTHFAPRLAHHPAEHLRIPVSDRANSANRLPPNST